MTTTVLQGTRTLTYGGDRAAPYNSELYDHYLKPIQQQKLGGTEVRPWFAAISRRD